MASDAQLLTEFNRLTGLGMSKRAARKQIEQVYNLNPDSVRGRISRASRRFIDLESVLAENERLRAQVALLDAGMYRPSAHDDTDAARWKTTLARLAKLDRMTKVVMLNDVHFPDHDGQALELSYRLIETMQPDLVGTGSDVFDMDALSLKFSRPYYRKHVDPLAEVRGLYLDMLANVKTAAPDSELFAIADNHGAGRFETYANEQAPAFGDQIIGAYTDLIRANGRVMWLGWQQETYIFGAMFEHGLKHGENAARANAKRRGWCVSGMAGHSHTPGWHVNVSHEYNRGRMQRRVYVSMVTPCLCNIPPHYQHNTSVTTNWVQGIGVAHVNPHDYDAHLQNVLFYRRGGGALAAVFGEREYVVKPAAKVYEFRG